MVRRARLAWRWALWLSAIAAVVPLWCVRFLPFSDMPEQVAVIASLRHFWDPAFHVQEQYTLSFGETPYILYHAVGALLSVALGDAEDANRVLLTLVGLSYPIALRALLRALRRDERLALFAPALFWSRPLVMGFLPYVASVPVVVWGLAVAVRQADAPTRARAFGLGCLALALFYLHADAFVLFVPCAGALTLAIAALRHGVRDRATAHACLGIALSMAPSVLLAAGWILYGRIANRGASLAEEVSFSTGAELLRGFPSWAHDIWRSHLDEWCAVGFWSAIAALALFRGPPSAPAAARTFDRVTWIPFACAIVLYFALPFRVGAGVMLNLRLAVYVTMFAPLLLRPRRGWTSTAAFAATVVASVGGSAVAFFEVRGAEQEELGTLDRLIERMEPGKSVLTLPFRVTSGRLHWAPYTFMGSYHRSRTGGVASFSFSELAHWPMHFRPEAAPPRHWPFWTLENACAFRNGVDGRYYQYVLTRGNVEPFRDAPPGPRWRMLDQERDWTLFEKIGGEESPAWPVDDLGPCESRRSLERVQYGGAK